MRNAFPYPLPQWALDEFRHPEEWHGLHHARRHGGEILAGNGYVAIRVRKGAWLDEEFPPASAEFLSRFGKLPWERFEGLPDDWRHLDHDRGRIFGHGRHGQWLNGKLSPSPVWLVNGKTKVRLSHLQLMAMLPRAEVYVGVADASDPLFVRFSGGVALVAHDRRLTLTSGQLFPPRTCCFTGARMEREKRPRPSFTQPGVNWPPRDESEI